MEFNDFIRVPGPSSQIQNLGDVKLKLNKVILGLAFAAALIFSASANAQDKPYTGGTAYNPCNTQFAGTGFKGYQSPFTIRFKIIPHYTVENPSVLENQLPAVVTELMNKYSQSQGYPVRFNVIPFTDNETGLNFTIWMDAYSTADGYKLYTSVGGWGAGHLFRFHSTTNSDAGETFSDAVVGLVDRLNNGWSCGTQTE